MSELKETHEETIKENLEKNTYGISHIAKEISKKYGISSDVALQITNAIIDTMKEMILDVYDNEGKLFIKDFIVFKPQVYNYARSVSVWTDPFNNKNVHERRSYKPFSKLKISFTGKFKQELDKRYKERKDYEVIKD